MNKAKEKAIEHWNKREYMPINIPQSENPIKFSKFFSYASKSSFLYYPRKIIGYILKKILSHKYGSITYFFSHNERIIYNIIRKIKEEGRLLMEMNSGMQIYSSIKAISKIKGDIAEVGVSGGGSAKIICKTKELKKLYLFDTFEGLPFVCNEDSKRFKIGDFSNSLEGVKEYLKQYSNVFMYKGVFPESSEPIDNKRFSFVHLDVDTYQSTKNCLMFFYPRMVKGGMIFSHDYLNSKGVRKAFDEFFERKSELVLGLITNQCIVIKS